MNSMDHKMKYRRKQIVRYAGSNDEILELPNEWIIIDKMKFYSGAEIYIIQNKSDYSKVFKDIHRGDLEEYNK